MTKDKKMPWDDDNDVEVKSFSIAVRKTKAAAALPVINPIAQYDESKDLDKDLTPEQRLAKTANKWQQFAGEKLDNTYHPALGTVSATGSSYRNGDNFKPVSVDLPSTKNPSAFKSGKVSEVMGKSTLSFSNSSRSSRSSRPNSSLKQGDVDPIAMMNNLINTKNNEISPINRSISSPSYNKPVTKNSKPISSNSFDRPALTKQSSEELAANRKAMKNRAKNFEFIAPGPVTTFVGGDSISSSRQSSASQHSMQSDWSSVSNNASSRPASVNKKPISTSTPSLPSGPVLKPLSSEELKMKRLEQKKRAKNFSGLDNMPTMTFVGDNCVSGGNNINRPSTASSSSSISKNTQPAEDDWYSESSNSNNINSSKSKPVSNSNNSFINDNDWFSEQETAVKLSKVVSTTPSYSNRPPHTSWPTRNGAGSRSISSTKDITEKQDTKQPQKKSIVKRIKCADGVIRTLIINPDTDDLVAKINEFCREAGLEAFKTNIMLDIQREIRKRVDEQ